MSNITLYPELLTLVIQHKCATQRSRHENQKLVSKKKQQQ